MLWLWRVIIRMFWSKIFPELVRRIDQNVQKSLKITKHGQIILWVWRLIKYWAWSWLFSESSTTALDNFDPFLECTIWRVEVWNIWRDTTHDKIIYIWWDIHWNTDWYLSWWNISVFKSTSVFLVSTWKINHVSVSCKLSCIDWIYYHIAPYLKFCKLVVL